MTDPKYLSLVRACESDLDRHGDNYLGVGWTKKPEYADRRYQVMLDVIPEGAPRPVSLLDYGCGASHLYEYILRQGIAGIEYSGLDLSEKYLALSRRKHPGITYHQVDPLRDPEALPSFDYIVMNGIFNSRCELSFDEMWAFCRSLVEVVYTRARHGIAFNVMTKLVDWEREDLFHLPLDTLAAFLQERLTRRFVIRHDYGLYEYTVYVYKDPRDG